MHGHAAQRTSRDGNGASGRARTRRQARRPTTEAESGPPIRMTVIAASTCKAGFSHEVTLLRIQLTEEDGRVRALRRTRLEAEAKIIFLRRVSTSMTSVSLSLLIEGLEVVDGAKVRI